MVCLSSYPPRAATLLRRGSRMAGRLNTDWYVVYVETPREAPQRIDAEAQRHLHANIERARELGAEVVRLKAADPVAAILDFARSHRVGDLIIGARTSPGGGGSCGRAVLERLVDDAAGLDVHIVSFDEEEGTVKLRSKLLLAQLPLALALLVRRRGVAPDRRRPGGQLAAHPPGQLPQRAGRPADEGRARAARPRGALLARASRRGLAQALRDRFEAELRVQEGNITEPGERPADRGSGRLDGVPGGRAGAAGRGATRGLPGPARAAIPAVQRPATRYSR